MTDSETNIISDTQNKNRLNNSISEDFTNKERTSKIVDLFTKTQLKLLKSMSKEEIHYFLKDCKIEDYITHLNSDEPGDFFPTLIIKGDPIQLEKFKLLIILKYMSLEKSVHYYFPNDFDIKSPLITGDYDKEKIVDNPNIVFVCIKRGSSTTEGMDGWRTKLISTVTAQRRATKLFIVILYEEVSLYSEFKENNLYQLIEIDNFKSTVKNKDKISNTLEHKQVSNNSSSNGAMYG